MVKKILVLLTSIVFIVFVVEFTFCNSFSISENFTKKFNFKITSGIDTQKNSQSTFDETRIITGTADIGTIINIVVFNKNDAGQLYKCYEYRLTVGLSRYFTQEIELNIGDNIIEIYTQDDFNQAIFTTNIKRKSSKIKDELENVIVLPSVLRR